MTEESKEFRKKRNNIIFLKRLQDEGKCNVSVSQDQANLLIMDEKEREALEKAYEDSFIK